MQIPARDDHDGRASITVTLPWVCPSCGGPRGEVKRVVSYDGSRRLACDGWDNPWSDNTTALAHVRLVVKKRARRVYGFLAWSEGGKRQEVFLAEATAPTRAGNLAMMWRLVAEQNLLDPAVRSERTAQRRSTWERRRPPEDPASRP